MRTSFLRNFWAAFVVALIALSVGGNAFAQTDPLDKVVGYDKMGGTQVSFSPVRADGTYTVTLSRLEGVAFKDNVGGLKPTAGPLDDEPTKEKVWIYAIPDGTPVLAFGLGSQWGTMSKDVNELDQAKAKSRGTIVGGKVELVFTKNADPRKACEMVNFAVITSGGNMWGAHPSKVSPWVVPNVANSPRTGWCVKGNQIVTVDQFDPQIRVALKAKP